MLQYSTQTVHPYTGSVRWCHTSVQLADPLVLGVARLWHQDVPQITEHGAVPPVVLVVLVHKRRHHLPQAHKHLDAPSSF